MIPKKGAKKKRERKKPTLKSQRQRHHTKKDRHERKILPRRPATGEKGEGKPRNTAVGQRTPATKNNPVLVNQAPERTLRSSHGKEKSAPPKKKGRKITRA